MKIVLAFDSFKGSLSARESCEVAAQVLRRELAGCEILMRPMADGGEGTAETVMAATGGAWCPCRVMGPLPEQVVEGGYVWIEATRTALVEMAVASGITQLPRERLNPLETTTFGTGQLIAAALARRPERLLLAVGGSATVDGGVGAAMACGWKFLDREGRAIPLGGKGLSRIETIVPPVRELPWPPVEVLCDVTNPLCGPCGAAAVYGPQKGATPAMVAELDEGLARLARMISVAGAGSVAEVAGAGAAGGLAGGALAFWRARLVPGIQAVMAVCGMEAALEGAQWVVTGEGRLDHQSFQGKVVSGVVEVARAKGCKVAVIAGQVTLDEAEWRRGGIDEALALVPPGPVAPAVFAEAPVRLATQVGRLAAAWGAPRS